MVGEACKADPPVGFGSLQEVDHTEAGQLLPWLGAHAVQQVAVDPIGPETLQLAGQNTLHVFPRLDKPVRHLCGEEYLVPVAGGQNVTHETFAVARGIVEAGAVVGEGGVDVVHSVIESVVQHLGGQRNVDAFTAAVDDRQPHSTETQDGDLLPRPAEGAI